MNSDTKTLDPAEMEVDARTGKRQLVFKQGTKAGQPVPAGTPIFVQGELIPIKGWFFKLEHVDGKKLVLEAYGPVAHKERKKLKNAKKRARKKARR